MPATHTKLANIARCSDCLALKLPAETREILGLRVKLAKQHDKTATTCLIQHSPNPANIST